MSHKTMKQPSLESLGLSKNDVLKDYEVAFSSRHASLLGRREVLSGKAKFGIFGDGKEIAQLAMARAFRKGDWRAGYYRDQTFMFAVGASDLHKFFAQLYADTNIENEPASGGRQMNAHFSTRYLDQSGAWLDQVAMYNSSSDLSPTAGQMARLLGLAYASKLYRHNKHHDPKFSNRGNEVAFGTIGDASTSEGIFWEVLNAAGVLQVPLLVSVWDDGYGISVPQKYQTTKESISELCAGFQRGEKSGFEVRRVEGWDYPSLVQAYREAAELCRKDHVPVLMHVHQLTQPQGHSTSGSHERYKSDVRMQFESDMDGLGRMRTWMIANQVASEEQLRELEESTLQRVVRARDEAWDAVTQPIQNDRDELLKIYSDVQDQCSDPGMIRDAAQQLKRSPNLGRRVVAASVRRSLVQLRSEGPSVTGPLREFANRYAQNNHARFGSHLFPPRSSLQVKAIAPRYASQPESIDGSQVIRRCFDFHLGRDGRIFVVGEDVGHLGGVNTEFEGLQEKHGFWRVTDTGIREASILGQGIGAAMRGLRPIVDIQYLDYVLYCLQGMSDDLATLHYRSAGGQIAPVIVRTKGHRLEGIWHTGSPMGTILHAIRGMHMCVPRNMVQAAGMYNTLLQGDDPAFVCEVLNGYRLKELVPENLHEFCVELGVPEIIRPGRDLTIVTYGACVRIVEDAAKLLSTVGIDCEIIDVCTLLPFDRYGVIAESLKRTNALMVVDEDVPGGASAYILDQCLSQGYDFLDAQPQTLTAQQHRGAYASDGDYYSKPNAEDVFDLAYAMMHERDPQTYFPLA